MILTQSLFKKCFKCGVKKPLSEFYKHSQMSNGHLNKCKECNKKDTKTNYKKNIKHYKLYDWKRADLPKRKKARKEYYEKTKDNITRKKVIRKSNYLLSNAIRDKRVIKGKCLICNTDKNIEGHHFDYSKPLDVWWLCHKHHLRIHKILNLMKILKD